jgi:hypothetical protein
MISSSMNTMKLRDIRQVLWQKPRYKLRPEGVQYTETYAPTAKFASIRVVIAMAAMFGWLVHQMDMRTAFLCADIDSDIHLKQPEAHRDKTLSYHVWKLNKALFGLKES